MASINPAFIEHITAQLPPHLNINDLINFSNKSLRPSIRVNTLKISNESLIQILEKKGYQLQAIPWCKNGFWITGGEERSLGNLVEHLQGLFYIQEASSMLPPIALFSEEDDFTSILDMAAAPGSKTTQIAAMMNNQGILIANEYSSSRVKMLHANLVRMGVTNSAITHFDAEVFGEYLFEEFDAILLDAPCGGEGTVRKDEQALKDWKLSEVEAIAVKQKQLICSAFEALKVGGTLVYSTCTLSQEENQQVCHHLKQSYPDAVEFISLHDLFEGADKSITDEGFLHVWPQTYDSEGFFIAKFKKTSAVERSKNMPKPQRNFPFQPASKKQVNEISEWLTTSYGIEMPEHSVLNVRDQQFWLFPEAFESFTRKMRFQRIGLKLAEQKGKHLKLSHEAATALAVNISHTLDISLAEASEYLKGRDIPLSSATKVQGEKILCVHNNSLGLAKHLGNKLKNNLPRDLVRDNATAQ
ncbi:16S rRNA (cytosine(1407)-C(5))-methyltransferase RsmF [Shewanella sp. OPT22]|nr:16S rRNA (cytosine(1407)-C(5))-methyltransferase RsmF [Shewanella sp. OPT22]